MHLQGISIDTEWKELKEESSPSKLQSKFILRGNLNGLPNGEVQTITFDFDAKPLRQNEASAPKRYRRYRHAKNLGEFVEYWNMMDDVLKLKETAQNDFRHDFKKGHVKFDNEVHQEWYLKKYMQRAILKKN